MSIRIPLTTTEGLTLLGCVISIAVAWGTLTTRLAAQEAKVRELDPIPVQLATISTKLDEIDKRTNETHKIIRVLLSRLSTSGD